MDENTKHIVASNLTIAYYQANPGRKKLIPSWEIAGTYIDILKSLNEKLASLDKERELAPEDQ